MSLCQSKDEIIERIMSQHWDMATCPCWICKSGSALGLSPRDEYLDHKNGNANKFAHASLLPTPHERAELDRKKLEAEIAHHEAALARLKAVSQWK